MTLERHSWQLSVAPRGTPRYTRLSPERQRLNKPESRIPCRPTTTAVHAAKPASRQNNHLATTPSPSVPLQAAHRSVRLPERARSTRFSGLLASPSKAAGSTRPTAAPDRHLPHRARRVRAANRRAPALRVPTALRAPKVHRVLPRIQARAPTAHRNLRVLLARTQNRPPTDLRRLERFVRTSPRFNGSTRRRYRRGRTCSVRSPRCGMAAPDQANGW